MTPCEDGLIEAGPWLSLSRRRSILVSSALRMTWLSSSTSPSHKLFLVRKGEVQSQRRWSNWMAEEYKYHCRKGCVIFSWISRRPDAVFTANHSTRSGNKSIRRGYAGFESERSEEKRGFTGSLECRLPYQDHSGAEARIEEGIELKQRTSTIV